jgi:importin-9
MGLKIIIDKWLLQQSLFRGKYTKISTFMALSKLFLLGDKRIDNLLVIGFNPSHTTVCVDVNAPLKILATLIRCLDN